MLIGQRLRDIREEENLSQGDIADATAFVRPYISRIENGHTVPGVETLEKWARTLGCPSISFYHEAEEPPEPLKLSGKNDKQLWGSSGRDAPQLSRLRKSLAKMDDTQRALSGMNSCVEDAAFILERIDKRWSTDAETTTV
jgi:transcriptional regulator with XRE-family HTH domain